MKIFSAILILALFCVEYCFSQNTTEIIHIDKLPPDGVLLDKGWKFHTGDNPEYANPNLDDSKWLPIDPTKGIHDIAPFAKTGIGWLRVKLALSNDLQKEQLALLIRQYIASEIYLNGRLIYRFGKISANSGEVLAYNPESLPVSVPLDFSGNQVLAIRYAFQSNLDFGVDASLQLPLLEVKIMSSNDAFKQVRINERHLPVTNTFRIGAYVILAFLYLAFFFYNPSYKAYLFFFLFAIFYIPSDILQFNFPPEIKDLVFKVRVRNILWEVSQLFLLTAMYFLLNQKKGWIYWSLIVLSIIGIYLNNWAFSELLVINLISLELVRTCFKSLKLKTRGSWIISAGAVCFLFLMGAFYAGVSFNLSFTNIKLGESYNVLDVLYGAGQLCIPIATTIYVALDFGFTSHALKQKLIEVEKLSQKTISQEMEKQQLLSLQNEILEKQVSERTSELKKSLEELKSTQTQLIQSAKMASLGELTAGIAHEIQNPLNFVNNFSEVSNELLDEMKDEFKKGDSEEGFAIANDIKQNLEKILHHGKRADAIVKGMLQHSQSSSGLKEPTDINKLADEYLRLAYHGLKAKDNSFNAEIKTEFDKSIGNINIIPQDIGRVLLNLYNNAFYALSTRASEIADNSYVPTVSVSTTKINDKVEIKVKDNGNGISQKIVDKIFQPFFTTKPTGQGTGLGLSLTYDIVKAHGGEIKVESIEGEGTSFIILLPA